MPSVWNILTVATAIAGGAQYALAQSTGAYTDSRTGIVYQAYRNPNFGGYTFGIALPSSPTNEFIGLLEGPMGTPANRWAGVSLGGPMNGPTLIVAWPNGNDVVTSFRTASNWMEPTVLTSSGAQLTKMNVAVNSTHWSLTFRCVNCNTWASGSLDLTGSAAVLGYAQSPYSVGTPSSSSSTLQPHDNAFANYGLPLTSARNANYASWIAQYPGNGGTSSTTTTRASTTTATTTSRTTTTSAAPLPTFSQTFDYIVVGAGAGGLIMADRLSESGKSVLLIERGPPSTYQHGGRIQPPWVGSAPLTRFDIPGLCNEIWANSSGIACTDISGGVMAGCVLGGGTAINSGLFWKPQPYDYDNTDWPTGWKYNDMSPYVDKVFSRIPSTTTPSQDGQRYGQDLYNLIYNVLQPKGWSPIDANSQPNLKNRTFHHTPYMYSGGQRGGPLATYLVSAKGRSNFRLFINTSVVKLNRNGGQITGVVTESTGVGGQRYLINVSTSGRVVLSAGVFNTAKILFRSGIGPSDALNVVKSSTDGPTMIDSSQWINLPVGENLHDQDNTDLVFSHPTISSYDFYAAYDEPIAADKDKYLNQRAGQLAEAAPNCNTVFFENFASTDGRVRQVQWTARKEPSLGAAGDTMVTLSLYLTTGATSRGRLTIQPSLNTVVSVLPYLTTQADIDAKVKAIQSWINAANNYPDLTFVFPTKGQTAADYLANYLGGHGSNHWMGTCRMGSDDGTKGGKAVVDLNTQVWGTKNLFVVDASIFPSTITANPSAYIMTVAERAAAKILALALNSNPGSSSSTTTTTRSTTSSSLVRTTTTTTRATTTASRTTTASQPGQTLYGQCGGVSWTGPTACAAGSCQYQNPYYSQCL
ncbi:hypothetical protein TWF106_002478 [Orbilia oligospora]|uniref:CBM1 domain-containing protein n=1 Tax=Orbilia oligospora TaxID=2813651 RepID=A0A7C8Q8H4_ORBOL|nr:hypothetical protein TWF788_004928 [Orbilia oligospora]KAF3199965.1 hypothetical protein TWF191_004195 [Orbilia oligospora]KAF3202155.1 hypothetical protein TWF106_002478 [Orbilia oligospora]